MERLTLEKVFHPFIAGAHNRLVQELSQETGARISIPPPSLPKDEIVITGEKEAVALALSRIRAIYDDKVRFAVRPSPPRVGANEPKQYSSQLDWCQAHSGLDL